ncbi:BTB/POZ domain-containing protein At3g08570-like isoform X3 [Trifolium pratense]|nr:BTB/POZ domain-containing protein At3g08570-like isoform X3 [Trifolium pratense]
MLLVTLQLWLMGSHFCCISGKIRKMVAEANKGSNVSNLELLNFPGGHQTFELAMKLELERRISLRLEMVSLDDLLIPSLQSGDSLFDVDTVHRLLVNFLQRIEEEETEDYGYESDGIGSNGHGSLLKVGQLIDAFLAEIAPDPCLSLQKFIALIEILPDYARVIDDGLYRAVDIYLKAHTALTEQECKKLCKFIDCQKLSQEACNHAAQNDRLPLQMVVQVLYFEQLRLKNAMSGSSGDVLLSQRISSGVPSAAMSPRDNDASLYFGILLDL